MARRVLVDAGPLVALLDRRDVNHHWVQEELSRLHDPLITCEAVLSEAFFLVSRLRGGMSMFAELLADGLVATSLTFSYSQHAVEILRSLKRYANLPMSFADACLVRMSEIERDSIIFTTDRDFLTYRRNRRQPIPLIAPF